MRSAEPDDFDKGAPARSVGQSGLIPGPIGIFADAEYRNLTILIGRAQPIRSLKLTPPPSLSGLYWSVRGTVLCVDHAGKLTNEEWQRDAWAPLPEAAQPARYQCQRCAPDGLALSGALGTEAWIAQAWGADDKE